MEQAIIYPPVEVLKKMSVRELTELKMLVDRYNEFITKLIRNKV